MKSLVVVACLLALTSGTLIGFNCDSSLNSLTVNSFDVHPWYPIKNQNIAMTMTATFNAAEALKSMEIFVKYDGVQIFHESVKETGTYSSGQTGTISFSTFLPSIAPGGSYEVDTKLTNTDGAYLNCWGVKFSL